MNGALRIGLAGLGTVGKGVLDSLTTQREAIGLRAGRPIAVAGVCARSRTRDRGHDLSGAAWFEDATKLATSPDIDVFVELIGGEEGVARASVEAALKAGKPVVTANKALLAHHGAALARLADEQGRRAQFRGGGRRRHSRSSRRCARALAGNGSRRKSSASSTAPATTSSPRWRPRGASFADVLAEAQKLGYAEADPTFDVGGFDTAHKLAILTSLAFGTEPEPRLDRHRGHRDSHAARISAMPTTWATRSSCSACAVDSEDGIEQRVHPTLVPQGLAGRRHRRRVQRRGREGRFRRRPHARGPRRGRASDGVERALRHRRHRARQPPPGFRRAGEAISSPTGRRAERAHEGGYYVALELHRPPRLGRRRSPTGWRKRRSRSRASSSGRPQSEAATAPFILITHDTLEHTMREALRKIEADGHVARKPRMIRIERL